MSWFTTSDYFIMDALARARAEELRETRERAEAYAAADETSRDACDAPKRDAGDARKPRATTPCLAPGRAAA